MARPAHATNVEHRRFLLEMLPPASTGAEIGVHQGDFSSAILDVVAPTRLHLVDPWHHEPSPTYARALYGGLADAGQAEMDARHASVLRRFDAEVQSGQVLVHRGFSADVLSGLPDDSLDWVYIDGNHLYEFVAVDLALSLRKVRPGGLVAGDDYREGGWWKGGVKRAVDEMEASGVAALLLIRNAQFVFERPVD